MADPLFELAGDVERALERLGSPRKDAGSSLGWAAFNLRAARIGQRIVEELAAGPDGYARIQAVLPEEWDVLEVAAMSLGFEDVTTALDLCANAVYLASGGTPSPNGRFKDLGYWTAARVASLSASTKRWVLDLAADPDAALLRQCREALAHRRVHRLIRLSLGGATERSLVEITTLPTPGGAPATPLGSIALLIPRLVAFGEQQFRLCCEALRSDFS